MFENRLLRSIFEVKRVETAGGWIKVHTGELPDLYHCQNIIRITPSRGIKLEMGEIIYACRILARKP